MDYKLPGAYEAQLMNTRAVTHPEVNQSGRFVSENKRANRTTVVYVLCRYDRFLDRLLFN